MLQEATEYVDNEHPTNWFHATHNGGCAVLFKKDTFSLMSRSVYFHDIKRVLPDKVMEGYSGWVSQGVLSRASFRRQPPNGQKTFTILSFHISYIYNKKRGIGLKLNLTIRAVMLGGR